MLGLPHTEEDLMKKGRFTDEQIVAALRDAEATTTSARRFSFQGGSSFSQSYSTVIGTETKRLRS